MRHELIFKIPPVHSPIPHDLIDVSLVMDGDEQSPWPTEDKAKFLAGEAHGGGVHDGHVLLNVLTKQPVEQPLVTVLPREEDGEGG